MTSRNVGRVFVQEPATTNQIVVPLAGVFSFVLSSPVITGVTDTNTLIDEQALTITGTTMSGATAVTIAQTGRSNFDATSYITSNDATTVVLSEIDVQDMGMAYGAATISVTTSTGGASNDFAITIQKKTAHQYVTLSGYVAGTGWPAAAGSLPFTPVDGDQVVAPTTTTLGGTFTLSVDGSFSIVYPGAIPSNDAAYWALFDDSADQWYEAAVSINPTATGGSSAAILNIARHRNRKHLRHR